MLGVFARLRTWVAALRGSGAGDRRRAEGPVHPTETDPWSELRRELARSRRYERTFVLVRIPCRSVENGRAALHRERGHDCRDELFEVSAFLRSVDRAWVAEDEVYVLLPECERAMGEAFLARVRRLAPEVLPEHGVRLAAFPADGSTSGALIAAVEGRPLPVVTAPIRSAATAERIELRPKQAGDGRA